MDCVPTTPALGDGGLHNAHSSICAGAGDVSIAFAPPGSPWVAAAGLATAPPFEKGKNCEGTRLALPAHGPSTRLRMQLRPRYSFYEKAVPVKARLGGRSA